MEQLRDALSATGEVKCAHQQPAGPCRTQDCQCKGCQGAFKLSAIVLHCTARNRKSVVRIDTSNILSIFAAVMLMWVASLQPLRLWPAPTKLWLPPRLYLALCPSSAAWLLPGL